MSLQAIVWALKQDIPNSSAKLLLISLANYADEDGVCWPSINRLAKDCSSSRQTVMNATKRLIDSGVITSKKRTGGSNYGAKSILYTLQIAESPQIRLSDKPKVQNVSPESQRIRPEPIIEPITTRKSTKKKAWQPPEWINQQAWQEFEQHRKDKRKPLTDLARQKAANALKILDHKQQQECIDCTIQNSWVGLFPEKHRGTHEASTGIQKPTRNEIHKQAYRDYAARSMGGGAIRENASAVWEPLD